MLGTCICIELLKRGYEVVALVEDGERDTVISGLPIRRVEGNILDREAMLMLTRGVDYVIHAAAITMVWPRINPVVMKVNYEGTLHLAEAALVNKVKRMVYISSASAFGSKEKRIVANENMHKRGGLFELDYIKSKRLAQESLLQWHVKKALPIIVLNPTFMIGPYDSKPSSGKILHALYNGKLPAYTSGGRNFVNAEDVATTVVNALSKGRVGQCYILGNENLSYKEFLRKACQLRAMRFKLAKAPAPLILAIGLSQSLWARVSRRKPTLSFSMAYVAMGRKYYDSSKAVRELDHPQRPIEWGMDNCLNWFENQNMIAMKYPFKDKVVVITGGSTGIGKKLALQILAQGGKVAILARNMERMERFRTIYPIDTEKVLCVKCDVSSAEECKNAVREVMHQFGRIDVLVNNADISAVGRLEDTSIEVIHKMVDCNLKGAIFMSHACIPYLKTSKGTILNISSIASFYGLPEHGLYSTSKAALKTHTQSLALELHKSGVSVKVAFLGFTENEPTKTSLDAQGNPIPVPARDPKWTASRTKTVNRILRHIKSGKQMHTHGFLGKTLLICSHFPFILSFLFRRMKFS